MVATRLTFVNAKKKWEGQLLDTSIHYKWCVIPLCSEVLNELLNTEVRQFEFRSSIWMVVRKMSDYWTSNRIPLEIQNIRHPGTVLPFNYWISPVFRALLKCFRVIIENYLIYKISWTVFLEWYFYSYLANGLVLSEYIKNLSYIYMGWLLKAF